MRSSVLSMVLKPLRQMLLLLLFSRSDVRCINANQRHTVTSHVVGKTRVLRCGWCVNITTSIRQQRLPRNAACHYHICL